jgi:hypothetical protein
MVSDSARPPRLPHRPVTFHRQRDVVLLHWRIDPSRVRGLVPAGTRPDVFDGSAWVAMTGYVFADSTVPPLPPLGRFGTMTEITVEILTIDLRGRRGIAYRTIDTQHVPAIVAARLGIGLPYTFARAGSRSTGDEVAHRTQRPRDGAHARLRIRAGAPLPHIDALSAFLVNRWGVHAARGSLTTWWRNEHLPWSLRAGEVMELDESLLESSGLGILSGRQPDSVLTTPGADVQYSRGEAPFLLR